MGELYGTRNVRFRSSLCSFLSLTLHPSGRPGYDKIMGYIEKAKNEGAEVLAGGKGDDSKGYFIQPTILLTKNPKSITMREEIFGPVVTVRRSLQNMMGNRFLNAPV